MVVHIQNAHNAHIHTHLWFQALPCQSVAHCRFLGFVRVNLVMEVNQAHMHGLRLQAQTHTQPEIASTHTHIHTRTHTHSHTHAHTHAHTHKHTHAHTHSHTRAHTHTTHTHTCITKKTDKLLYVMPLRISCHASHSELDNF